MEVIFSIFDDVLTAELFGELDHHQATGVREAIDREINEYDTKNLILDFSKVSIDVNTLTSTITVSAPAVEILSTEVDEDSLVIYDESRNIFTPLTLNDVKLSRTAMIDEIKTQAVNNNLLENARMNAEVWIRLFLQTAYDPNEYAVEFKWQKESAR